jgi:hypothetical protein
MRLAHEMPDEEVLALGLQSPTALPMNLPDFELAQYSDTQRKRNANLVGINLLPAYLTLKMEGGDVFL